MPDSPRTSLGVAAAAVVNGALMVAWWAAMAGGFPALHRMAWANRWVPLIAAATAAATLVAVVRRRPTVARRFACGLWGLWLGIGMAARVVFPISSGTWWLAFVGVGLLQGSRPWRRIDVAPRLVALAAGAALGASWVTALRSPEPTTQPAGGAGPGAPPPSAVTCQTDGTFTIPLGAAATIAVNPLLRFGSVSPDRSFSALAPGDRWRGVTVDCIAAVEEPDVARYWFQSEGSAQLDVQFDAAGDGLRFDVVSELLQPVYSHLNAHVTAVIVADGPVALRLSPCPDLQIAPGGPHDPSVLAYVDDDGAFVVARARSREKGPFTTLCRAAATSAEDLQIAIEVGQERVGTIAMPDWVAQTDRSLSPTAGYGVPANAIEFWADDRGRRVQLSASLSATSIGRGWHTVGHRAGVYRNRVRVVSVAP